MDTTTALSLDLAEDTTHFGVEAHHLQAHLPEQIPLAKMDDHWSATDAAVLLIYIENVHDDKVTQEEEEEHHHILRAQAQDKHGAHSRALRLHQDSPSATDHYRA